MIERPTRPFKSEAALRLYEPNNDYSTVTTEPLNVTYSDGTVRVRHYGQTHA